MQAVSHNTTRLIIPASTLSMIHLLFLNRPKQYFVLNRILNKHCNFKANWHTALVLGLEILYMQRTISVAFYFVALQDTKLIELHLPLVYSTIDSQIYAKSNQQKIHYNYTLYYIHLNQSNEWQRLIRGELQPMQRPSKRQQQWEQ